MKNENTDFIIGRHPAVMALKSDQEINKVFIQSGLKADAISQIVKLAKERHLVVSNVPKNKLDLMTDRQNHQGVVLAVAAYQYATIDDLFDNAAKHDEDPFFLILDELEDPHNLGSILRTAEATGVHGVIIPKRRAVGLTGIVAKTSAGSIEKVPVVRVTNIAQTVELLKQKGVWVFATAMSGEDMRTWNSEGAIALVIGNEGQGVSQNVIAACDGTVTIPMTGTTQSLNASVAAGVLMYEVARNRLVK